MSRLTHSPLEFYESGAAAIELRCFACDQGNRRDAERCHYCRAPMAFACQAANRREVKPQMLAVLGPRGAGKTSYLGMLCDCLSRQLEATQAVSRGASSVSLQQQVIGRLVSQRFPESTPDDVENWNWNHVQMTSSNRHRVRELVFPDMSGAVMERELDGQSSPITRAWLEKCAGALVVLDTQKIEQGDSEPECFAMKLLHYLGEFGTTKKVSWRHKPIGFVLTKSDVSQSCFDAPRAYAEMRLPDLFRQAVSSLRRFEFFATSIAGGTINLEVSGTPISMPLRIEPRGIRGPMAWMMKHLG